MRVIAGKYRSRPLRSLRGLDVRPTTDRLRETLFNVLTAGNPEALSGAVWLDLFAGTGAVGIEALSRGARQVYFVDSSPGATATIRANLESVGIEEGFEVMDREALPGLRRLDAQAVTFDYCFLDPPYRDKSAYEETLGFLSQANGMKRSTVVIAEHDKRFDPGERFGGLERYRMLKQGDAALSFYRINGG
jgi:16S rRNA (guanine966-N2)-methyltransferase